MEANGLNDSVEACCKSFMLIERLWERGGEDAADVVIKAGNH